MYGQVFISCLLILGFHIGVSFIVGFTFRDAIVIVVGLVIMILRFQEGIYDYYQKRYFIAWCKDLLLFSFFIGLLWQSIIKISPESIQYFRLVVWLAIPFAINFVGFLGFLLDQRREDLMGGYVIDFTKLLWIGWIIYLAVSIFLESYRVMPLIYSLCILIAVTIIVVVRIYYYVKEFITFKTTEPEYNTVQKVLAISILVVSAIFAIENRLEILTDVTSDIAMTIVISFYVFDRGYKMS
jgi:hypothetical protein